MIRQGARIGDLGGAAVVAAITEGVPEYEVALAGTQAMVREIARSYPRRRAAGHLGVVPVRGQHRRRPQLGDLPQGRTRRHPLAQLLPDDRRLLHSPGAHPVLRAARPRGAASCGRSTCAVHERGLQLIKPGAVCSEIAAELNEIYVERACYPNRTFGYGHSFGVLSHYYGREAGLELREDIHTVLEPGMVVSMEPMITIPEGRPGAGGYRRTRHPGRRDRRRGEHHQVPVRPRAQHPGGLRR